MYKKQISIFSLLILSVIFAALKTGSVFASGEEIYGGAPVYGGGVVVSRGEMLLDKKVRNPASGEFVDHLGPTDPKYRPQTVVTFQINVRNAGDSALENITIVDTLPRYLDFMDGPGTYNKDENTLTFNVEKLDGGTSQTFEIKGRVVHPAQLPQDRNIICPTNDDRQPVNVVDVFIDKGQQDHDESQYCIEKEMEVPEVPQAGAQTQVAIGFMSTFLSGWYLRRKYS